MVKTIASGSNNRSQGPRVFRLVGGKVRKESPPPATPKPALAPPSPEQIRDRAYAAWCQAGRPPGDGVQFWLEAERALRAESR